MRFPALMPLVISGLLGVVQFSGLLRAADDLALDAWLRLRGTRPAPADMVIVTLDESFITAYGVRIGELDRRFYARTIENLQAAGARAIGLDVFFPEATAADEALALAVAGANVVLPHVPSKQVRPGAAGTGTTRDFSIDEHVPYNPDLEDALRGVITLEVEARRFRPLVPFADGELPSFALAVAQAAGLETKAAGSRERLVDYRGPSGSFRQLSFLDAYRGAFAFSNIQNAIVLVGVTLQGTDQDLVLTPFGPMSGVEVLANEISTLAEGRLAELPGGLQMLLLLLLGSGLPPLLRGRWSLLVTALCSILLLLASFLALLLGSFVPPLTLVVLPPLLNLTVSYGSLRRLDRELTRQLIRLLDGTVLGEGARASTSPMRGFSGHDMPGEAMLTSLLEALGGHGGLLVLEGRRTQRGQVDDELRSLAEKTLADGLPRRQGETPYLLSEPILGPEGASGVVALALPVLPSEQVRERIATSAATFGQVGRYRRLRNRTTNLASRALPRQRQSSLAKIDTLAMITDLIGTERNWLGTLLESLPQAVFITTPFGYTVYRNALAREMFGDERNLLKAVPQIIALEPERFRRDFITFADGGGLLELVVSERSGGRPLLLELQAIRQEGTIIGLAGAVNDIGVIEEAVRLRQELADLVVHDLRNPLSNVMGFSELLLESVLADGNRKQVDIIRSEAKRMITMIDQFLTLSRLESGTLRVNRAPTELTTLVRQVVAGSSGSAASKGISFALSTPPQLEAAVDADLLSRALANLLANAIKYSPADTRVRVSLEVLDSGFTLTVTDEGFGMNEAQQERVFEPYERLEEGPQLGVEGTGLGLYMVRQVVEKHGGSIELNSTPAVGSAFRLVFPGSATTTEANTESEAPLA